MAEIGLKHLVAAKLNAAGAYTGGIVIAKARKVEMSLELAEAILYGDDGIAESIKEFGTATLSVEATYLPDAAQELLLGHVLDTESVTLSGGGTASVSTVVSKTGDLGDNVGFGFYAPAMRDGVKKFRAFFFPRVQFGEPGMTLQTKEGTIAFNTPTTTATIASIDDGTWKEEALCDTEEAAIAWVDGKVGI